MPKAHRKSREEEDDDTPLHGTINKAEARRYSLALDDIIIKMGTEIKDEVHNAMREAILAYKEEIKKLIPGMDKADADAVWCSIKDKVGLCIYPPPPTEDSDRKLECLIPDEEVPSASGILKAIEDPEDLTAEDRTLITKLFDSLEVAHSELASACSVLGRLSKNLKLRQLMVVLKVSIRPLIQIKPSSALIESDAPGGTRELPDDPEERVEKLMIPDPASKSLRDERVNSPTRLLAAAWSFMIINVYSKGMMQKKMQELYSIKAKQLAACITGRKYLGGTDRKRNLSGQDDGASTSKKATME